MPLTRPSPSPDPVPCEVCGHALPPRSGSGRPRVRHAHCDHLGKTLNWLESSLEATRMYLDDDAKRHVFKRIRKITEILYVDDYVGDKLMGVINRRTK